VQYLIAREPDLSLAEVKALVESVTEKDLKRRALVTRIDFMLGQQRWEAAQVAIKEAAAQLQPEGELRSALNLQQMQLWLRTKKYDALVNGMNNLYLTERDKRRNLYFKASIAAARGRDQEAAERFKQAEKMLLYDEDVVLAAADFFSRYKPKEMTSYEMLLEGITYNPYSAKLYKAYALESINKGLDSYADQALVTLRDLLSAVEYSTFIEEFQQQRQQVATRADNWQL
jgi:hypothetical protein